MRFASQHVPVLFVLFCILSVFSLMTMREYVSVRKLATELVDLKEEYNSYVLACRRFLSDRNRPCNDGSFSCDAEDLALAFEGQPPNMFELEFPVGSKLFSCLDGASFVDGLQEAPFAPVVRDSEYLDQATEAFDLANGINKVPVQTLTLQRGKRAASKKAVPSRRVGPVSRAKIRPTSEIYRGKRGDFMFSYPVERSRFWLSSRFGNRKMSNGGSRFHYGIDMAALKGTAVKSAAPGVVASAGYVPGYGNCVVIIHNKKYKTRYAHMNRINVKVGEKVARGARIGSVGDTGTVRKSGKDGSHLHFEILAFGRHVNPLHFLR